MYAIIREHRIIRLIEGSQPFELDDIQYPSRWLELNTVQDAQALGIYPVVRSTPPDERFNTITWNAAFWNSEEARVEINHRATPIPLSTVCDNFMVQINAEAKAMLADTDWMVIRAAEDPSKPIPTGIADWRAAMRAESARVEGLMRAATEPFGILSAKASLNWPVMP